LYIPIKMLAKTRTSKEQLEKTPTRIV
jgi:hypothetical protein